MNRETVANVARITTEQIAAEAYRIWEKEGRPHGRDREHWLRAEALLTAARLQAASQQAPPQNVAGATEQALAHVNKARHHGDHRDGARRDRPSQRQGPRHVTSRG